MSCYHPQLLLYEGINSDTGKPIYKFTGQQGVHERLNEKRHPKDILIPCRRCIGCRLDYSRRWADRLMLELDHSKTALFFTLTYDDEHVTPAMFDDTSGCFWYTLVKKDLQDFNKRLRWHFRDKQVRFYSCGEYGSNTLRPHYHGIYFGLSLDDFPDKKLLALNHSKQPIFTSDKLRDIWKNGHVSIGNVSWQSCAYVARYNLKKLEHGNDLISASRNCIPEFSLMSRNPGISGYFHKDHPEIFDSPRDKIFIEDTFGQRPVDGVFMPSYIFEKLALINKPLYDKIKEEKKIAADASFFDELSRTDLYEFDYLCNQETLRENKAKGLIRPLST